MNQPITFMMFIFTMALDNVTCILKHLYPKYLITIRSMNTNFNVCFKWLRLRLVMRRTMSLAQAFIPHD